MNDYKELLKRLDIQGKSPVPSIYVVREAAAVIRELVVQLEAERRAREEAELRAVPQDLLLRYPAILVIPEANGLLTIPMFHAIDFREGERLAELAHRLQHNEAKLAAVEAISSWFEQYHPAEYEAAVRASQSADEQPHFNINEAISYAKKMGLPTEFESAAAKSEK